MKKSPLQEEYNKEIRSQLQKNLKVSPMAVPNLKKIVVNVGLGEALQDKGVIETVVDDVRRITGQQPVVTRARVSIANFKVREGDAIGVKVTLRGDKMCHFFSKLVNVVFPQIKDFRGFSKKGFDGHGNITIGLEEQSMFFEIDPNKVQKLRGMEITIVTDTDDNDKGYELLKALGFPFREAKAAVSTSGSVTRRKFKVKIEGGKKEAREITKKENNITK